MVDFPTRSDGEVLTAEQLNSYLDAIEANDAAITSHASSQANPHGVTKAQVGLGNVDNTSDANKPVSTATQTALNGKANASHTHVATTDLTATGTKSSSTFLRGDNTWATPPNTTYSAMSQAEAEAGTATTARTVDAARLKATILYHAPVKANHVHVVADLTDFASSVTAHADVAANTAARHNHTNKAVLDATTASYTTAEESKLSGIEAGADVTDAANVNAAGAVMNADATTAAMAFVVDEDTMTSDSATKVPTQQSVKAYVDSGLAGKANASHTHAIANITGLQSALDSKAAVSHTHTAADVTDFGATVAAQSDVAANTSARHTHSNAAILNATTASYTTAEETKLSGIEAGADKTDAANVNAAGAVMTSDTSTAGMGFVVDEDAMTSNANTKVPTQQSVKAYVDAGLSGKAATSHTHTITNITGLQAALDAKAASSHTHTVANITDFASAVSSHTDVAANTAARHSHSNAAVLDGTTASYTTAEKTKLSGIAAGAEVNVNSDWDATSGDAQILNKPTTMPPSAHTHATSEVTGLDSALSGKANTSHTHHVNDMTATGTKSSSTYLRGDNTWATPTNTTYSAITQAEAENAASTTARLVTGQRLAQAVAKHPPATHTHTAANITDLAAAVDARVSANADVSANTAARHTHANAAVLNGTTASYTTAEESKLAGIEAGADVTDATNVNAAGAVMNSDTTTAAMSFVVDEDAMTSNSATKVPTQQSVKAYVDSGLSGKANSSHTHNISDLNTTGTPGSGVFLRGDGVWATTPNTTYSGMTQSEAEGGATNTPRLIAADRLKATIEYHAPVKAADLATKANATHDHGSDYIWGGSWLSATATRIPVPITITGGKAYNDLPAAGSGANYGTSNAVARADHAHDYAPSTHTHAFVSAAVFTIDGDGATITTGVKGDLYFPFGAVITGWTLLGDQTGSISVSVWKDSYGNYPPTVVDDICGSETPTISSSTKGQDLSLTTWSPLISSGDTIRINVNSATNIQRATLILHLYKTTN